MTLSRLVWSVEPFHACTRPWFVPNWLLLLSKLITAAHVSGLRQLCGLWAIFSQSLLVSIELGVERCCEELWLASLKLLWVPYPYSGDRPLSCDGRGSMSTERIWVASTDNGSGELQQPLLQTLEHPSDDEDFSETKGHQREQSALVPHSINRIDWQLLWQTIIESCSKGWSNIWGACPLWMLHQALSCHSCGLGGVFLCSFWFLSLGHSLSWAAWQG